ncbi:MAG: MMPL family transporter [Euryarchaeota archaeon]|nr:MMPL family transporter [Euryarchaeota archaeon]
MRKGVLGSPRVLLLLVLVVASVAAIRPTPSGETALRYGLELEGGSWLLLQLQGALVEVEPARGVAGIPSREEVASMLSGGLGEAHVVPARHGGREVYEVRRGVAREEVEQALGAGGRVVSFTPGVTRETLDGAKRVLDRKLDRVGFKGIVTRAVGDDRVLVELAGVDLAGARRMVGTPGRFEMRMQAEGNRSVFVLDSADIVNAYPDEETPGGGVWGVFLRLSRKGADALRDAALRLGAVERPGEHEVIMLLDGEVLYSAPLSPDLARSIQSSPSDRAIAITGTGEAARERARELYIHLSAGALPVSLEVSGSGQVPPTLGARFKEQVFQAMALGLGAVALVALLRYRDPRIAVPMVLTSASEALLLLGFAAAIRWQMDLASLAGIIVVLGTGVDHLIIITDEIGRSGGLPTAASIREAIRGALRTIFRAAATTAAAMVPLAFFGFGALSGFAFVTLLGLAIGVGVARPAYARILAGVVSSRETQNP